MQTKKTLGTIAGIGILALAGAVHADSTWTGGAAAPNDRDWNNADNWNGGVPGASDVATIANDNNPGPILDVNVTVASLVIRENAEVDTNDHTLTVTASAGLDIDPATSMNAVAGKLKVDNVVILSGGGSHPIDGDIVLQDSDSVLRFTNNNATFSTSSSGNVTGEDGVAKIEIAAGKEFTSQITIQGALQIKGLTGIGQDPGIFRNEKLVHANRTAAPFVIEVMANTGLEDASGAVRWMASNSGSAKLLFQAGATGLAGDFSLSDSADLEVTQDVSTTGDVCVNTGSTVAATGVCFDWGSWSCSTAPQDAGKAKPLCSDSYTP